MGRRKRDGEEGGGTREVALDGLRFRGGSEGTSGGEKC